MLRLIYSILGIVLLAGCSSTPAPTIPATLPATTTPSSTAAWTATAGPAATNTVRPTDLPAPTATASPAPSDTPTAIPEPAPVANLDDWRLPLIAAGVTQMGRRLRRGRPRSWPAMRRAPMGQRPSLGNGDAQSLYAKRRSANSLKKRTGET